MTAKSKKKPTKQPGKRAIPFRANVEARLHSMGWKRHHYEWQTAPARLSVVVDGAIKKFNVNAGMSKELVAYELGKLAVWAEIMNYSPRPALTVVEGAAA